jgi:hypothetical protein
MLKWFLDNIEWIFSGVGIILISTTFMIIKQIIIKKGKKVVKIKEFEHETCEESYRVNIGSNTKIEGNVAGRDIIINQNDIKKEIDQLIKILEQRAELTIKRADKFKDRIDDKFYKEEFLKLHEAHIKALKEENLIYAHFLLCQIHGLSEYKQRDAAYKSCDKNTLYSSDSIKGLIWLPSIIDIYLAGTEENYNKCEYDKILHECFKENNIEEAIKIYKHIIEKEGNQVSS